MKISALCFGIFLIPLLNYAQTNQPDTLQLDIKTGEKIILIGKDLNRFRTIKVDSIIKKALFSVKDSITLKNYQQSWEGLTKEQRKEKYRAQREASFADKTKYTKNLKSNGLIRLRGNIGAGMVRSSISPFVEAGITIAPIRQDYYSLKYAEYTYIALTINRFYTFKDSDVQLKTINNTFINASIGNKMNTSISKNGLISEFEMGIGYLTEREGNYFGKNTFKLFGSVVSRSKFIRITPELYISDFRTVFPGFSLKFL